MSVHLLDANILIALLWPAHEHHVRVQDWFNRHQKSGWATCPITQAAIVRILSNPAFSRDALSVEQALSLLESNLQHPAHHFWRDDISIIDALSPLKKRLTGHQQLTDAYLIGLARHHKGRFATMDRAVMTMVADAERQILPVTLI